MHISLSICIQYYCLYRQEISILLLSIIIFSVIQSTIAMANDSYNMPAPDTFIFWLERFLMLGLYLIPCIFPASTPRILLPLLTIFLIFACNWLYFSLDEDNYENEIFKFLDRWAAKDRYAFILERCSMFVLLSCFWWISCCPHDAVAGYDYKWLVPYLMVFIIFPFTNFMYTPWCPFFQNQETKKIPILAPTSVHHQSVKYPTKLTKINPDVVPTVGKAEHSMKLFDKDNDSDVLPLLEKVEDGEINVLNPAKIEELSIEESDKQTLLAANLQNQDEVNGVSHGNTMEKCANHEEQKHNCQEERSSLASELEALEEANGEKGLKEMPAKERILEEERLILASSNLEEVEDRNKAAKTQEFSHGVALEMTLRSIYGRDLSNTELFYIQIVKELEASWEKKMKEKQDKHEEEMQKWGKERMSVVSEVAAAKSEAKLYHNLLLNKHQYYLNLMEEKNNLAEKLTQAIASSEVYRSLLHNLGASS